MPLIGIFDSGVGGLTVQKAIFERLPWLETIYLGDTARVPYGSKSPEVVTQYSLRNARFLVERKIDLLVVACNTASAVALPALRRTLAIPVLGVVEPGARAAVRASAAGRIGVIGTSSTIGSGAYQRAIHSLRPDAEVVACACPLFVPLAEEGWTDPDDEVVAMVAHRYLVPLAEAGVDTLVLGCTHYPLLKAAIAHQLPGAALVDSAEAIAAEVAAHLETPIGARESTRGLASSEAAPSSGSPPIHRFYVTDTPDRFLVVAERFLGRTVASAEQVDI